jgi:hypothetical protein
MSHFIRQSTPKTKFATSFISKTRKFVREGLRGKQNKKNLPNINIHDPKIINLKITS